MDIKNGYPRVWVFLIPTC